MVYSGEEIEFSGGYKVKVNCGIIGIDENLSVHHGYDGHIDGPDALWREEEKMSAADCVELADFMLARWADFRAKHFEA